jgi:hypothetical protein
MENFEVPVRKLLNLVGEGASSNLKRNWRQGPTCNWGKTLEDSGSNTGQRRPWGRPAQPTSRPSRPPFDLAAIQAIYSPEARLHASTHSLSASEEQRREGHHLGEERVELVD